MSILKTITEEYGEFKEAIRVFGDQKVGSFSQNSYNAFCKEFKPPRLIGTSSSQYFKSIEWLLRQYSASKKIILSALFFIQTRELTRLGMKNLAFYSAYYALFNALSANLILHPHINFEKIKDIRHKQIFKDIENYFIKQGIYDTGILSLLNDLKMMRELYSYHLPLNGLQGEENRNLEITALTLRLENILPSILQVSNILSFLAYYAWDRKVGKIEDEYSKHQSKVDHMFFSSIQFKDNLGTKTVLDNGDYYAQGYLLNHIKSPWPISWFIQEKMCDDFECGWGQITDEQFDVTQVFHFLAETL